MRLLLIGLLALLAGSGIAYWAHTDGGRVQVQDIRFKGESGRWLSGLLYVPQRVDAQHPAPGVLAVHGYINSRETQSGFAIELARRGMVVLALDQRGHGYSEPPAFADGFGGPDGLAYLRNLPMVDESRIGLTGHSMGGWAVLAAAAARPDAYRTLVLVGSSTGTFGAPAGNPSFPRNLAVVFSRWDEFSTLMWDVPRGADIVRSEKLKQVFGVRGDIEPGVTYGSLDDGSARVLFVPHTTHPGDHLSMAAIGDAVQWLTAVLRADPSDDAPRRQSWMWKELGTLLALGGAVALLIAVALLLLRTPPFAMLRGAPAVASAGIGRAAALAVLPVLTYFPVFALVNVLAAPSWFLPQGISNGVLLWCAVNGLAMLAVLSWRRRNVVGLAWPAHSGVRVLRALSFALLLMFGWFGVQWLLGRLQLDLRFWVVAAKLPAAWHWPMLAVYAPPLMAFFVLAGSIMAPLIDSRMSAWRAWLHTFVAYGGGFVAMLLVQYAVLLSDRPLPIPDPLMTIVAIQFVFLLGIAAAIQVSLYRATSTVWCGAFVNGLWIAATVIAGQATQFAVLG